MAYITGVSIFCPAGGRSMLPDTAQSLYELGQLLKDQGIDSAFWWSTCADVEDIRNYAITKWYDTQQQASHLLMVDSDMRWNAGMVWDMLQFDQPLTGVMYAKRMFPTQAIGRMKTGAETSDNIVSGHLEVAEVGAGVLLIKREVVDKMLAAFPELIDETEYHQVIDPLRTEAVKRLLRLFEKKVFPKGHPYAPNGGRLSEDLSFCYRWREVGGKVWANVHHPVSHIGPFSWTIRFTDFLQEQKARVTAGEVLPAYDSTPGAEKDYPPVDETKAA